MRKPPSTTFVLLMLLVLTTAIKLAIVLAPSEKMYGYDPKQPQETFVGEELHRGTIAIDLIEGPILRLSDYQYAPFFGGSLVVGLMAVPFFLLFGPSIVALKLTGIVFNAITVAFVFLILARFFSKRAAWIGGLLAGVAAPGYTALTLTAYGTHMECNALALACVYLYLRATEGDGEHPRAAFLLGVTAGFATYFGYIVLIVLGVLLFCRFLDDRRFFARRSFGLAAAGYLLGLVPWFAYNVTHGFAGLEIYGASFGKHVGAVTAVVDTLQRARDLLLEIFPRSFFFQNVGPLPGAVLDAFFAASFALLAVASAFHAIRVRSRLVLPCLLHPIAFVCAYAITDFKAANIPTSVTTYRYVYSVFPFLIMAAAVALDAGLRTRARKLVAAWVGLLILSAFLGSARLVAPARFGVDLERNGYHRPALGRFIGGTLVDTPERVEGAIDRLAELDAPERFHEVAYGMGMYWKQVQAAAREDLQPEILARIPVYTALQGRLHDRVTPDYKPYFEPWRRGDRLFGIHQRHRFWADYRERQARDE